MRVVVKTKNLTRKEWLEYRTNGIGGSDVSIIAGINPFRSVHELWLEKRDRSISILTDFIIITPDTMETFCAASQMVRWIRMSMVCTSSQ